MPENMPEKKKEGCEGCVHGELMVNGLGEEVMYCFERDVIRKTRRKCRRFRAGKEECE